MTNKEKSKRVDYFSIIVVVIGVLLVFLFCFWGISWEKENPLEIQIEEIGVITDIINVNQPSPSGWLQSTLEINNTTKIFVFIPSEYNTLLMEGNLLSYRIVDSNRDGCFEEEGNYFLQENLIERREIK